MDIEIKEYLEGSRDARGLVAIIDIFRASSMQAILFGRGVGRIIPAKDFSEARELSRQYEQRGRRFVIGECDGLDLPGLPNSPTKLEDLDLDLKGAEVVHASTNGVRGLISAAENQENTVISASFLNYRAVADYIIRADPKRVNLVAMGEFGQRSPDDYNFAEMLREVLQGRDVQPEKYIERVATEKWNSPGFPENILGKNLAQVLRCFYESSVAEGDAKRILDVNANLQVVPRVIKIDQRFNMINDYGNTDK